MAHVGRTIGSRDGSQTGRRWLVRPRERPQLIHLRCREDDGRRVLPGRADRARGHGNELSHADRDGDEYRDGDQDFDKGEASRGAQVY